VRGGDNAPDDVAAALATEAGFTFKRIGARDEDGYFRYVFTSPSGTEADVSIPSVALERFHEAAPGPVYVDGNSWTWCLALEILAELDDLSPEGAAGDPTHREGGCA